MTNERNGGTSKDVPLEDIFGLISRDEVTHLLDLYERQQQSNLKDKPVISDQLIGGSFAKLLYSKPGFHNPGSTSYLINDLKIKDINRDSLLGGQSNFVVSEGQSLSGLKKQQINLRIVDGAKLIHENLDKHQVDKAREELMKIRQLNRDHPDVLAASGIINVHSKTYDLAVEELKAALNTGCNHPIKASYCLSVALFELGSQHFHRGEYQKSLTFFQESLLYDKNNASSILHLKLAQDKIDQNRPFGTGFHSFSRYRK